MAYLALGFLPLSSPLPATAEPWAPHWPWLRGKTTQRRSLQLCGQRPLSSLRLGSKKDAPHQRETWVLQVWFTSSNFFPGNLPPG